MIEHSKKGLSVRKQCELLSVNRSRMYYKNKPCDELDVKIVNEMLEINLEMPFYGYRRMKVELENRGYKINNKKVKRLMRESGIKAIYPKKRTTITSKAHKKYPYLLREVEITRPDQVWGVDITYVKIQRGYAYLVALIDVFSRKIMGWKLSPYLDTISSLQALEEALKNGTPGIVNSDQGSQYTSADWTTILDNKGIEISMDGKGRWADNIYIERFWRTLKYESVYLHCFENLKEARKTLGNYILFYNQRRPHQSLGYKTPDFVYNNHKKTIAPIKDKNKNNTNLNMESKHIIESAEGGEKNSQKQINLWS